MPKRNLRFFLDYRPERVCFSAGVQFEDDEGRKVAPIIGEAKKVDRHGVVTAEPLDGYYWEDYELRELLQNIVNEAHQKLGIVPAGWDSEVKAQKYHLEDMRKLAFKGEA